MELALKSEGKRAKREVEAKLGGVSEEVVGEAGPPGPLGDDAKGNTLKIPERAEGERDSIPTPIPCILLRLPKGGG